MQFAVSSYAAIREPLAQVQPALEGLGVAVEIMCEPPHAWPEPVPWSGSRPVALHMPTLGLNIASTNPGIRAESVRQVEAVLREAARLGAGGAVVHPGSPPYEEVMPRDRGLPYAVESLRRLCETAARLGVEVYLENMPDIALGEGLPRVGRRFLYGIGYDELRGMADQVGHPALRLCLDVGHAHLAGRQVLDAMLGDRDVVHVHVSDNRGWRDDHLAWGDGEIGNALRLPDGLPPWVRTVVVEVKSLEACRQTLARLMQDSVPRR